MYSIGGFTELMGIASVYQIQQSVNLTEITIRQVE